MATKAIKPGDLLTLTPAGGGDAAFQSDEYASQQSRSGQWAQNLEVQVFPESGNTAFSVTVERSLDQSRGFQVVATITTAAITKVSFNGGWFRVTIGTATGGPVTVLAVAS
jgi:hypothetical protein